MKLYIVGLGPGNAGEITPRALAAIRASDVVAGYSLYIEFIQDYLGDKTVISTAMKGEVEQCRCAVEAAAQGQTVSVVSSGDAGVYGVAGLVYQLAEPYPQLDIEVIPGITAACAGAAVLGAPLIHDFAVISLSGPHTRWQDIENRLRSVASVDFILCLYNPSGENCRDHFAKACAIVGESRAASTPCGVVRNAGRNGETGAVVTLEQLASMTVDMHTTIFIGNSSTTVIGGRLVTPGGYLL